MRVLLSAGFYDIGGSSTVIENLANCLSEKGVAVTIGALVFRSIPHKGKYNVRRIPINNPLKLKRFLDAFDIIHSHHPSTNYLGLISHQPSIYHYHGLPNLRNGLSYSLSFFSSISLTKHRFSAAIAVSEAGRHELEKYLRSSKIFVIHNGVDTDLFKPEELETFRKGQPQYLFVGNLYNHKNVAELLSGFRELLTTFPKAHLQIVGSGSFVKLSKFASDLRLNNNITFVGPVAYSKLPNYYNSCDVYVTASKNEAFPLPLLEAWACDKIVVASAIPAHTELIKAAGAGLTYKLGDVKGLAQKMILAYSLQLSNSFCHGVKFAETNTWANIADQILRVYSSII